GGVLEAPPGPAAPYRRALRRGAFWPLVVRRTPVVGFPRTQAGLRPAHRGPYDAVGVLGAVSPPAGGPAVHVQLGLQRLQRSVAQRRQRLDLPPPAHRGPADGPAGRRAPASRRP